MKKITFPEPLPPVAGQPEVTADVLVRESVLTLNFWKLGGLKRVEACLEIETALDADPAQPRVSDDTANLWAEAMQLLLPNGNPAGNIPNPRANRYYMRVMRAVLRAESVDENLAR